MKLLGSLLMLTMTLLNLALSEIKILNTPDGAWRPPPCALICSGVARYDDTGDYSWINWGGQAYKAINIADCGFNTKPVVTATMSGDWGGDMACPTIYIRNNFNTNTMLHVETRELTKSEEMVTRFRCDVYWSAAGYTC